MQSQFTSAVVDTVRQCDEWEDFLSCTQHGDLLQSSSWAQLKAAAGWRVLRLTVREGARLVGGAQILVRSLPFVFGAVGMGYVPRGPVLTGSDAALCEFTVQQLRAVARERRLQMLIVQPPRGHKSLTKHLVASDFRPSTVSVAPTATMRIDLSKDCDHILSEMKSGVRYNVRRSQREGITVRHGSEVDLTVFSQLHAASSQRQGFSTYSEEYFANMWRLFATVNRVHLLISEYEGEAVSAMLLTAFGNTVWAKRFGWSGKHGRRSPNEALLWAAITWAKDQGYRYFDQDGIARRAANALINDEPVPDSVKQTPTYFKLGFGGEALVFPDAYVYMYNPVVRFAYTSIFSKITKKSVKKKVINSLRLG